MTKMRPPETWTDFCRLRWTKREKVHSRLGKVGFERFLKQNDLPHSRILKRFGDPQQICLGGLPEFFVIKPANLWSARGVMLLRKLQEDGFFFDDMKKRKLTQDGIVESQMAIMESLRRNSLPVIAEERVIDEDKTVSIPMDYKMFTFLGEVKFILQVDRNHKKPKLAFFDGDFQPILDNRVFIPTQNADNLGMHRKPMFAKELIELARTVSLKLMAPFVSIDCYSSKDGPILGELTHTPGGPWYGNMYRFSIEFDRELGRAWHQAASTLDIDVPLVECEYDIVFNGKITRQIRMSG